MTLGLALHVLTLVLGNNPYLDRGRHLFDQLAFPEAEAQLKLALELPTSSAAEHAQAADLLARARAAQGDFPGAEAVYAQELARNPHLTPPSAGPKLRGLYLDAKERLYPQGYVRLESLPAVPGELSVRVIDPWDAVAQLRLVESTGALQRERPLKVVEHAAHASLSAAIPSPDHFSVVALDGMGHRLRVLGPVLLPAALSAPAARLLAEAPAPAARTHAARWVAWVVGGVSLAAAIAGTTEAVLSTRSSAAAGRSHVAVDRRALDAQARAQAIPANFLIGGAVVGGVATGILAWRL